MDSTLTTSTIGEWKKVLINETKTCAMVSKMKEDLLSVKYDVDWCQALYKQIKHN